VLTGRQLAAKGAFLDWLALEPRARLDPTLVRPEVVDFFERLRAEHRDELLREVERRRPRTAVLNLLPPAGQYQNGQRTKFAVLLAAEVGLLALNLTTGIILYQSHGADGTFAQDFPYDALTALNWTSFAALAGVLLYGVIDGFVVYQRIRRELAVDAESLRAAGGRAPIALAPGGLTLRF
jgi:hypothetical protein